MGVIRNIAAHDVVIGKKKYMEYAGLSGDTKPTNKKIATGSTFLEVDTGNVYLYNEDGAAGEKWVKVGGGDE